MTDIPPQIVSTLLATGIVFLFLSAMLWTHWRVMRRLDMVERDLDGLREEIRRR